MIGVSFSSVFSPLLSQNGSSDLYCQPAFICTNGLLDVLCKRCAELVSKTKSHQIEANGGSEQVACV